MSERQHAGPAASSNHADVDSFISEWLIHRGVPRFTERYRARDHLPVLARVLAAVLAFELGMAPWLGLSIGGLLLTPGIIALTALVIEVSWRRWAYGDYFARQWHFAAMAQFLFGATVASVPLLIGTLVMSFTAESSLPDLWSDFTVDFVVIFLLVRSSFRLAYGFAAVSGIPASRRRKLLVVLLLAIVVLAFEGALFPSWPDMLSDVLPLVPQGVMVLFIAILVLWMSRPAGSTQNASVAAPTDWFSPAIPVLVLTLCADGVLLPYVASPLWQVVLPLAATGLALGAAAIAARWRKRAPVSLEPTSISYAALGLWLAVYVCAYPLLVGLVDRSPGEDQFASFAGLFPSDSRFAAALFVLVVNIAYLLVAWALAALAVERIFSWAIVETIANLSVIVRGLVAHLPLVLLFAAFFLIGAETWEIAVETEPGRDWEFWLLIACLVGASVLVLFLDALRAVQRETQRVANDLAEAVGAAVANSRNKLDPDLRRLAAVRSGNLPLPSARPSFARTINAVFVVGLYQALIFGPLAFLSFLAFLGLAEISVPPNVATTWIFGDDAGAAGTPDLRTMEGLQDPWVRVALLLTAFALLERVVRIVTETDQRSAVLGQADRALRDRLALARLRDVSVAGRSIEPLKLDERRAEDRP